LTVSLSIERASYGRLILPDAAATALQFFTTDISSRDPRHPSYDDRSVSEINVSYDEADTTAIRRGMRLNRAPKDLWTWTRTRAPVELLQELPADADLVDARNDDFERLQDAYSAALKGFIADKPGRWRRLAVATKIMHVKRPLFVPILDNNVLTALGLRLADDAPQRVQIEVALEGTRAIRQAGVQNRSELSAVEQALLDADLRRPPARILDALLWLTQ
jgi:hypothetical protein